MKGNEMEEGEIQEGKIDLSQVPDDKKNWKSVGATVNVDKLKTLIRREDSDQESEDGKDLTVPFFFITA